MQKKGTSSRREKKGSKEITTRNSFHKQDCEENIPSDVLGSYTGTGDKYEEPVQDADDL